jgi:prepilin signal peptidase PulO-like enzyme (type II secretory pathway)
MDVILWAISSVFRWMRLKIYQYEVTFALYMLTPIEKLIFSTRLLSLADARHGTLTSILPLDTVLLTLVTMVAAGIYIYLPDHLRAIYGRLYYYWAGERLFSSGRLSISSVFGESATAIGGMVYETAKHAAATTTQRMERMAEL